MDYIGSLEKAILFIEYRLGEDIKVEEVAAFAGYSYFHFHRIFEAVTGESIGSYLRSRRLNRAADDLIYTDKRIIDIAVEYRFESQEAFTRAFKKRFRLTPGVYRRNRINVIIGNQNRITPSKIRHIAAGLTVKPKIVEFPGARVVGVRGTTTLRENKIPALWEQFNPRVEEIIYKTPAIRGFGICEINPDYDMTMFNEETVFNEFVGVEVTGFSEIPAGMESKILHGGKYAVFTHQGSLANLKTTYEYIWGTWIPCSGHEVEMREDFELYDERFVGLPADKAAFDIYLPVR